MSDAIYRPCQVDRYVRYRAPQNGITFDALGRVDDAAMVVEDGMVAAIAPSSDVPRAERELDLRDCVVVPGFVDAHAHPLYAGDREPDLRRGSAANGRRWA